MKSSTSELFTSLENFLSNFISEHEQKYQCLPKVQFDADWPSPCEQGKIDDEGFISWRPVLISEQLGFTNVESALEISLHEDIKAYFTSYYSESVPAECEEGYLELLFVWNKNDFERLQQNIIGHTLMKRKLKQRETIFFAVTDDDNVIVSIDNQTGVVYAEKVGKEPHKKLANTLSAFIDSLSISL